MAREVKLEKRGGVGTPLRLFLVVYDSKGLYVRKVAEKEVTLEHGRLVPKEQNTREEAIG